MKKCLALALLILFVQQMTAQNKALKFFAADNVNIQYTGRIDFSDPLLPRFWQPGVYFNTRFVGVRCEVILNDQVAVGKESQLPGSGGGWCCQTDTNQVST